MRPGYGVDRPRPYPRAACPSSKVLLAEPRGFCAGVEMAIKALAWMVRVFEPPVYCYHEIVHNRLVVDRFREQGVVFVDDVDDVPAGAPLMLSAHGSRARGRRGGPRQRPLRRRTRCARSSPRCTTRSRCGPARASRSSTSATPATTRPSARWRSRPTSIQLVEHDADLDAAARRASAIRAGRGARADHARAARVGRRRRAHARARSPTCGPRRATTCASPPPTARTRSPTIAERADAVVVIGSANSSNTIALDEGRARGRLPDRAARRRARRARPDALGDARIVGVTAGASAPEELVEAVIARLAPRDGVEVVRVTDEDEYFPPPRELRELLPAGDTVRGLLLGCTPCARHARLRRPLVDASTVLATFAPSPASTRFGVLLANGSAHAERRQATGVAGEEHGLVEEPLELDLELGR